MDSEEEPEYSALRMLMTCLVSQDKKEINSMMQDIRQYFDWVGLQLNPMKCASLSMINNRGAKYVKRHMSNPLNRR